MHMTSFFHHLREAFDQTTCVWRKPVTWTGLASLWALFVVAGPFGTGAESIPFRVIYWGIMMTVSFFVGTFVGHALLLRLRKLPSMGEIVIMSVITGFVVAHLVIGLDVLIRGSSNGLARHGHEEGLIVVAFCVVISAAAFLFDATIRLIDGKSGPRLLARTPEATRGELISVSGDGRYVEVVTSAGSSRVLMRLCDAISETQPVDGVLIHRSHWVALDHVRALETHQGRKQVLLSDGRRLPVSRSGEDALADMGAGAEQV